MIKYEIKIKEDNVYLLFDEKIIYEASLKPFYWEGSLLDSIFPDEDYLSEEFLGNFCYDVPHMIYSGLTDTDKTNMKYNYENSEDLMEDLISTFNKAIKDFLNLDDDWHKK